jgi:hypothetical protein
MVQKTKKKLSTSKQSRRKTKNRNAKRQRGTRAQTQTQKQTQVPLVKQMKDNPWMEEILKRKANGQPLNNYDKYLYSKMKQQPLPKGGITKLIQKYK